jgi:hypothetical protein
MLMSALAQHPQCRASGCLLAGDTPANTEELQQYGNWQEAFQAATAPPELSGDTSSGFISHRLPAGLQPGRGTHWVWTNTLWQYLEDRGRESARVLHLYREDPIARAISEWSVLRTGVKAAVKMSAALREHTARAQPDNMPPWVMRALLDEWQSPGSSPIRNTQVQTLSYESLVADWPSAVKFIQAFLGLDPIALVPTTAKLGKIPPHTSVTNWETLVESFRNTQYEVHFEQYMTRHLPTYMKQSVR